MLDALHAWWGQQLELCTAGDRACPLPAATSEDLWHLGIACPTPGGRWPDPDLWLAQAWQIDTREALVDAMLWLAAQGERQRWDIDAAGLKAMSVPKRLEWQQQTPAEDAPHAVLLPDWVAAGEPLEWAAWDWLRLAELAWAGACCGYLTEAEAEHFAGHAAELLHARYDDWQPVLAAYLRGLSLFVGADCRGLDPAIQPPAALETPGLPWQRALAVLLEPASREASRAAMRSYRATLAHWLQAIAGVRDPELTLRQREPGLPLPEPQRREAERYLEDALELYADEGAEALGRYWLPAQAHHLNQMAADATHGLHAPSRTPFGRPSREALAERGRLGQASRHAATVHMAEKFAFYLHTAMDSRRFDEAALLALGQSLKSCLCHFYATPTRLLEAWLAWERCLPEPDQAGLEHDIAWHLNDPGSVFHWVDWQPGAWQEPGERPSLRHFTAMALVGPLNSTAWRQPEPESPRERESIRAWVEEHYQLHDAEELRGFIDTMLEAGDRQEYQINYAPYTLNRARLDDEIAVLQTGDSDVEERNHRLRLERVRDNEDGCNECDMAAWDIAQTVDLAIAGRELGWLDPAQLARILERAYALAENHYGGWQEYAEGLYTGFSFFMGETGERESFLAGLRHALVAWCCGAPVLAGAWASLDFPGGRPRHFAPLHIDTLPGDRRTLH
ncbi:YbeU/YbeR family protein [Halomonas garicola]|uniref:YbeU/YbeR family protein n=1 Tax=Halomonas garicola TaxID=1690008 RepID=UPI002899AA24|nr:YbeU/YbeR family protein [Halomonas garicola]